MFFFFCPLSYLLKRKTGLAEEDLRIGAIARKLKSPYLPRCRSAVALDSSPIRA